MADPRGRERSESAPTFVLVHGGFHGGWCWRWVAQRLRAEGYAVSTPTLSGSGERAHQVTYDVTMATMVTDIVHHLEFDDLDDVVLVGHSFGGCVITGVADQVASRLRRLVYLDGLILDSGRAAIDLLAPHDQEVRRRAMVDTGTALVMNAFDVTAFGIPAQHPRAEWVARRLTPHPGTAYTSSVHLDHPVGNGVPATYVMATDPAYDALEPTRRWVRAHRPQWTWTEIATGHDAMILEPEATADLLEAAAGSAATEDRTVLAGP